MYERWIKIALDRVVATALLVLLALPTAVVALAIRVSMGPPILFKHTRIGRGDTEFQVLKFRTMRHPPSDGSVVPSADRISKLGQILRRSSLDEIPQLLNVLRGEMSLVGPRPLLPEYLELYSPTQRRRHEVRPGITGLAQVSGRSSLSWTEKFEKDVDYIDDVTLVADLRILWNTAIQVVRRADTSPNDRIIAERFNGHN